MDSYRDVKYVRAETTSLALQLSEFDPLGQVLKQIQKEIKD